MGAAREPGQWALALAPVRDTTPIPCAEATRAGPGASTRHVEFPPHGHARLPDRSVLAGGEGAQEPAAGEAAVDVAAQPPAIPSTAEASARRFHT